MRYLSALLVVLLLSSCTESKFICTKYQKQKYKATVAKPGVSLPYTEFRPKKRICAKWKKEGKGITKRKCVEYKYVNSSPQELKSKYKEVERIRTICVEGYSTDDPNVRVKL